jgi:hypothetical protein
VEGTFVLCCVPDVQALKHDALEIRFGHVLQRLHEVEDVRYLREAEDERLCLRAKQHGAVLASPIRVSAPFARLDV